MINTRNANEFYATLENANSRRVLLPKIMETAGVESDENVRTLKFKFPKIVDGADLTQMQVCINYMNSRGERGQHIVSDLKPYGSDESYVTFSWPFTRTVTRYRGLTKFVVCAVKAEEDMKVTAEWNTSLAQIRVLEGLEVTAGDITPDADSFIAQLMAIAASAVEAAKKAVEAAEKFDIDSTLTLKGRAADAKVTGERFNNISSVTPEQFGAVGDGVTDDSEAIQKMVDAGKLCSCPAKTYAIHGVKIGKNVNITGDGTVFLYNNTAAKITTPEDSYILYNRDADNGNVNIQGIIFDGNKESVPNPGEYTNIQGSMVVFDNFKEINFRNCVFKNSVMDGAFLTSCGYVNFHDCVFSSIGKRMSTGKVGTFNAFSVYKDAKKVYVKNCHFNDITDEGIRADDFELMSVEDCVFTDMGQFIIEPIFETVTFCRLNFKNNYVENTGGTCIAIRPHSNTRVDLSITNNTFKKIGAFSKYRSNETNIGILETSSTTDDSRGIVWVDNNNISIVSDVCKHVFYLQACLEAYIKNNRIEVSNNPGSRKLVSINGTSALTMMDNTFICEYSEGYSDKSYVLDLYNAKADFVGNFTRNTLHNLKHLAKMPLSAGSVGVVQSIYAEGNIASDADTLLNISNNTEKINIIKLIGNECAYLAEFARKGTKKFIAIGNDCTDTIKVGRILAGDIYEAANTNTALIQSEEIAEAGGQQK